MAKTKSSIPNVNFLNPHRHQDIERALVLSILDEGWRTGIGEQKAHILAGDLAGDIQEIARVEPDLNGSGIVVRADFFARGPRLVGSTTESSTLSLSRFSFTARVFSWDIVDTRSTAWAKSFASMVRTLSLAVGITR